MTRKDYILLASAIRESHVDDLHEVKTQFDFTARCVCAALSRDNPRFDRAWP